MSDYFSEDSYSNAENQKKITIRFCKDCSNMLYPRDFGGKLAFECIAEGCGFQTVIQDSFDMNQNMVSQKKFTQEDNDCIESEFITDPTMQRDYETACDACGNKESVFFMKDNQDKSKIILVHICCERSCQNVWKKRVEGDEDDMDM